jgi:hypothetical protein
MATGLIMAILVLFMAPMSVREVCTSLNQNAFVRDELQLESFREGKGRSSAWLEAHVVSTGESFRTDRVHLVGLDRLRELTRESRLEGYRTPVWYLPKHGLWPAIDTLVQFRVRTPAEFDQGFPAGLVAVNAALAWLSFLFIRRGAGFSKAARAAPR